MRAKSMKYKGTQISAIKGCCVALTDCINDWCEQIITSTLGENRIYTATIPATTCCVYLMQDRLYRTDLVKEKMSYFYLPQQGGKLV